MPVRPASAGLIVLARQNLSKWVTLHIYGVRSTGLRLCFVVDEVPFWNEMLYLQRGSVYYSEANGYVHYLYHPDPRVALSGNHGMTFEIEVADSETGGVRTVRLDGPYSGVASYVNRAGFGPIIDCDIIEQAAPPYATMSGAVTVDFASKMIERLSPGMTLLRVERPDGGFVYRPVAPNDQEWL